MGYVVVDADEIAHRVLASKSSFVAACFGEQVLKQNGEVDRAKLGEIVFKDKKALLKLESIVSPGIRDEIFKKLKELNGAGEIFFVDIPLYFEKKEQYANLFNAVILIYAPAKTQLARLMARNSLDKAQASARIKAQMDIKKKQALADIVVQNLGSSDELRLKAKALLKSLKERV